MSTMNNMSITEIQKLKKSMFLITVIPKNQTMSYQYEQWVMSSEIESKVKELVLNHILAQKLLWITEFEVGVRLVYRLDSQGKERTNSFFIDKSEIASIDAKYVSDPEGDSEFCWIVLD